MQLFVCLAKASFPFWFQLQYPWIYDNLEFSFGSALPILPYTLVDCILENRFPHFKATVASLGESVAWAIFLWWALLDMLKLWRLRVCTHVPFLILIIISIFSFRVRDDCNFGVGRTKNWPQWISIWGCHLERGTLFADSVLTGHQLEVLSFYFSFGFAAVHVIDFR